MAKDEASVIDLLGDLVIGYQEEDSHICYVARKAMIEIEHLETREKSLIEENRRLEGILRQSGILQMK